MCCDPSGYTENEINGVCVDCGEPTVDGDAYENCAFSPRYCLTCNHSPCDESC